MKTLKKILQSGLPIGAVELHVYSQFVMPLMHTGLVGIQAGLVCTQTHLLLLLAADAHETCSGSSDEATDDVESYNDNDVTAGEGRQLKLMLRIRKRYDKAVITVGFKLLICAKGGTIDIFQVHQWFHCRFVLG